MCIDGHGGRQPLVLLGHWVSQLQGDTAPCVALEKMMTGFQSQHDGHDSVVLLAAS